jgi:hypothetical protein
VRVSKFSKLGLPQLWGPITLCADLQLKWGMKQSCNPHRDLFNDIWHVTCTQGNWGDPWLLVVGGQIANLTPCLSFGHNLCFKCPNGSCKPILDIYIPRSFQWYKEILDPMGFDPYNCFLKIRKSIRTPTPKMKALRNVRVHSLTLSHTPKSMKCDSRPSHLARTFVSPCFGHKPKARITTSYIHNMFY